ncbi:MAG: DUF3179 domain-containing protein [Bacteroidota bacterium]
MKRKLFIGISLVLMALWGCEKESGGIGDGSPSGNNNNDDWSIPRSEIFDGGPGKDGIPALTEPNFIQAAKADYVGEEDLVIGFVNGDVAKAYPHSILDWHEIINDRVGDVNISITYCPLTGTGIGWNRDIDGHTTTFGVSGLLYNSNLIPYDRQTDSNWSQMRLDCVNGKMIGTKIETFSLVETTWSTWKEMYPSTTVVSSNTGHNRSYGQYPYGSYRTNDSYLIFPVANEDDRIPNKDRVHGIVASGNAKVYPLTLFGETVAVIQDSFEGEDYVIVGNETENFAVSYMSDPGDGTSLSFSAVQDQYPIVMTDSEGNMWDLFGTAVSGPRKGTQLTNARSFIGYWFSFAAFYPHLSIYEN